jgi:EmrB/QacA subfamily drug resistance transporter
MAEAPRRHYKLTLAVLVTGGMAYGFVQSLVIPALPELQRTFHSSETSLGWVLTAYLLSASVCTPILGRLGDMYGKDRLLLYTLVLFAAGVLLSALATSLPVMLAGRVVQGAGGGIFPLAFGIIRDEFPRERVSHGIALMSSLLGVGGGLGLVLAGPILDGLSYHWLFWIPFAVTAATAAATRRYVPESPIKVPGQINWLGATLLSTGLVVVLVAVSETTTWGWGSARTLAAIGVGLAVLVAWVRAELRAREPLIDMRMMRLRGVWTSNVVGFLVGAGMYSSFVLVPQYVQEPASTGYGFAASLVKSGLFLLPSTMLLVLVGQFAGALERRFGSKALLTAGTALLSLSFVMLVVVRAREWEVFVATGLLGAGIALSFSALGNLVVESVPQHQTGVASGMNTVMRTLGGALGGQIAATFLAHGLVDGRPTNHAYGLAFALCAVAAVLALVLSALVPGRRRALRASVREAQAPLGAAEPSPEPG